MVKNVVCGTLMGMGFDVVNIGLASTPTTELSVTMEGACGGIILTASHNQMCIRDRSKWNQHYHNYYKNCRFIFSHIFCF